MKWVEKYAPKSLGEVLGNVKPKAQIEVWANNWNKGEPQKPLLLMGPPGIGKTTIAHLIGKEYFAETIEVNASDKRSYDILKSSIGESAQTRSLFHSGLKLLIMDEVDGISGRDDSGGVRAINETIKNAKQPLIMMANDPYSKRLSTIKNKTIAIKFTKIHTNSINAQLKRICEKEEVTYDPEAIKKLATESNGDLRSAITSLEAVVDSNKHVSMESIDVVSRKDNEQNIFETLRVILKSKNPATVSEATRDIGEPNFLIELLAENIPREYEKVDEIAKAYEEISLADINLGRTLRTQNYTYWKYAFLFMSRGVAAAKKSTYKKFVRYSNSTVYAKLSKARKKKNLTEDVTQKMSVKLHTSPKELEKQLPYYKVLFEDNDVAYDLKEYFRLTDDEVKLFRSRKIPASIEKKRLKELKKREEKELKEYQEHQKQIQKNKSKEDQNKSENNLYNENTTKTTKKTTKKSVKQTTRNTVMQKTITDKSKKVDKDNKKDTTTLKTIDKQDNDKSKKIDKIENNKLTDKKTKEKKSYNNKSKQTTLFDF